MPRVTGCHTANTGIRDCQASRGQVMVNRMADSRDTAGGGLLRSTPSMPRNCGCVILVAALALSLSVNPLTASSGVFTRHGEHWIGTWATAPQRAIPGHPQTFRNQTVRLIVHTSAGGTKVRIKISNTFGDEPLIIGAAHIARRASGADIDPTSDRTLTFRGHASTGVAAGAMVVSDPVDLQVPPLSEWRSASSFPMPQ
jgi:hypothetical protein